MISPRNFAMERGFKLRTIPRFANRAGREFFLGRSKTVTSPIRNGNDLRLMRSGGIGLLTGTAGEEALRLDFALLVLACLLLPAVIIRLCMKFPFVSKIGPVIVCYAVGMAIGAIVPSSEGIAAAQDGITSATVALALPLLLFSMNLREWRAIAGRATLSMILAVFSVIVVVVAGFMFLRHGVPAAWQLGGMAVGLYTGGTPNLAALRTALGVDADLYVAMHTYDAVIGLLYILFAVSLARPLFSRFLPRFVGEGAGATEVAAPTEGIAGDHLATDSLSAYDNMLRRPVMQPLFGALGVSIVIVGASVGLADLFPADFSDAVTILAITALAVGASFIPKVRQIPRTFPAGMYLIYVFCVAVGSMANFGQLVRHANVQLLGFVIFCVFGALFLHAALARMFNIDVDTVIITSVSAICSPPFVPVVAQSLGNPRIILSGLYTGIIGYAVGNFLGVAVAYFLRALS